MASLEKLREAWQRQLTAAQDKLGPRTALIGIAISWHLNRNTGEAFPGMNTLATLTGVSRSTVKRSVATLVAEGHMARTQPRKGGANHYQPVIKGRVIALNPPRVTAMDLGRVIAVNPEPLNQPPTEPGKKVCLGEKGRKGVPVESGTDQWEAWSRLNDARGLPPLSQREIQIGDRTIWGRLFPSEWPPQ
jgi:hypothetical protein